MKCDWCEESVDEGTTIWVNWPHKPFISRFLCVDCNQIVKPVMQVRFVDKGDSDIDLVLPKQMRGENE